MSLVNSDLDMDNPRKMVKLWAEKEMRNLKRLWQLGIPYKNEWAYPRLKDAIISSYKYPELYYQLVKNMRTMYHKCRLHDHPHALEFLRKDCTNVIEYFKKKGVRVISIKELFDFITDINISMEEEELEKQQEQLQRDIVDEEVFKRSFIPRKLDDVIDVERNVMKAAQDGGENVSDTFYSLDYIRIESENQTTIVSKEITREMNDQKESENEDQDDLEDSESSDDSEQYSNDEDDKELILKKQPRGKRK
ncbi:1921_t:CDS:2 [Scutellospora calospora]|uniref:1921_t:CDS:1 n=1 Tax=Scutellospora calospora TaxID=85575 RepID=A0ACA9LF03_9GLOM|nr:1921_t:CDS:2 [Scutellospora calospora]